ELSQSGISTARHPDQPGGTTTRQGNTATFECQPIHTLRREGNYRHLRVCDRQEKSFSCVVEPFSARLRTGCPTLFADRNPAGLRAVPAGFPLSGLLLK